MTVDLDACRPQGTGTVSGWHILIRRHRVLLRWWDAEVGVWCRRPGLSGWGWVFGAVAPSVMALWGWRWLDSAPTLGVEGWK